MAVQFKSVGGGRVPEKVGPPTKSEKQFKDAVRKGIGVSDAVNKMKDRQDDLAGITRRKA